MPGILTQLMDTSLSFLLLPSFMLFISPSVQCPGDTQDPKVLALGSLPAVGTAFPGGCVVGTELWPFCLRCVLQGGSSEDNTGPTSGHTEVSEQTGRITQIFLLWNLMDFFSRWLFSQETPPKSSVST